ncbi:MAG: GNAT family N-acetyltransferase [Acutalibacter sp.]|jgi:GNAT superfamily N-acetyltransferase
MHEITLERVETQPQIDTLTTIAQQVWHETFDPILEPGQTDYMIDKFQSDHAVKDQMAHQNYRYYLAKLDGRYAGFVGFAPWYEGQEEMYLSKVYLLSECRGQGVTRKFFDLVEEETRKEGLHKIRLTVNKYNTHAYQVYQHYGYENVESVKTDIGSGYYMDDYVMVKRV